MKVRVKQNYDKRWFVETWVLYWPFWTFEVSYDSFDREKEAADQIKNPTILEVQ
jgi:regulatory protein YycH of two-component signal transduction system YycFG